MTSDIPPTRREPGTDRGPSMPTMIILFFVSALYWFGFSMVRPAVSLYLADSGLGSGTVGFLLSLQAFAPFLMAIPAGGAIDRIGYRKALAVGAVLMGFGSVMCAGSIQFHSIGLLVSALVMNGLGSLFSWGALQASVAYLSRSGQWGDRFRHLIPNFTFITSLAQFAGPSFGGWMTDASGYLALFFLAAFLALLSCMLSPWIPQFHVQRNSGDRLPPDGAADPAAGRGMRLARFFGSYKTGYDMMKTNRMFFLAILLNGVLFILVDVRMTFFPIYMDQLNFTNTQIGFVLSTGGVAAVIVRPLVGYLMHYINHMWLMLGSILLGAVCLLVLACEPAYGTIAAVMFVWGACTGINQPIAMHVVAQSVTLDKQGMGMSLRTMSNRVVQFMNPIVFGGIAAAVGISAAFGVLAGALVATAGMFYAHQHRLEHRHRHLHRRSNEMEMR